MLTLKLDDKTSKRLEALSKKTGQQKNFFINEAILAHLDDLEDYYLCEVVAEAVRNGEVKTYKLKEVERELGINN